MCVNSDTKGHKKSSPPPFLAINWVQIPGSERVKKKERQGQEKYEVQNGLKDFEQPQRFFLLLSSFIFHPVHFVQFDSSLPPFRLL